jgi:hypothetical protein
MNSMCHLCGSNVFASVFYFLFFLLPFMYPLLAGGIARAFSPNVSSALDPKALAGAPLASHCSETNVGGERAREGFLRIDVVSLSVTTISVGKWRAGQRVEAWRARETTSSEGDDDPSPEGARRLAHFSLVSAPS